MRCASARVFAPIFWTATDNSSLQTKFVVKLNYTHKWCKSQGWTSWNSRFVVLQKKDKWVMNFHYMTSRMVSITDDALKVPKEREDVLNYTKVLFRRDEEIKQNRFPPEPQHNGRHYSALFLGVNWSRSDYFPWQWNDCLGRPTRNLLAAQMKKSAKRKEDIKQKFVMMKTHYG